MTIKCKLKINFKFFIKHSCTFYSKEKIFINICKTLQDRKLLFVELSNTVYLFIVEVLLRVCVFCYKFGVNTFFDYRRFVSTKKN